VLHLRHASQLLEDAVLKGGLQIVGGEYNLETGLVDFFELQEG
jgi:carbonic anhydrase